MEQEDASRKTQLGGADQVPAALLRGTELPPSPGPFQPHKRNREEMRCSQALL